MGAFVRRWRSLKWRTANCPVNPCRGDGHVTLASRSAMRTCRSGDWHRPTRCRGCPPDSAGTLPSASSTNPACCISATTTASSIRCNVLPAETPGVRASPSDRRRRDARRPSALRRAAGSSSRPVHGKIGDVVIVVDDGDEIELRRIRRHRVLERPEHDDDVGLRMVGEPLGQRGAGRLALRVDPARRRRRRAP